jgi:hypothetical protein
VWSEVPEDLFLVTEFGFYLVDYNVRGRTLTCTRSYLMPQQRITPEKYPRMLDFISQVSSSAQQRVAYAPVNVESFGGFKREIYSAGYAGFGENKSAAKLKKPELIPAVKKD